MKKIPRAFLYVLLFTLSIKLILAFSYDTADTGAMDMVSKLLLQGEKIYSHPDVHFSPPPFQLHALGLLRVISNFLGTPFTGFWKIPAILADSGIAILIFLIGQKRLKLSQTKASQLGMLYALNPISWYVSGFHGQAEAIILFGVLFAWYLLIIEKKLMWAAVVAGLALSYKLPAALLLPGLVWSVPKVKDRFTFGTTVVTIFFASLFPELIISRKSLIKQVFLYESLPKAWGVTSLISKIYHLKEADLMMPATIKFLKEFTVISLVVYFFKFFTTAKHDFFKFSLGVISIFMILTPGFSVQFLLLPLPFLILSRNRFLGWYSFLVLFGFVHTYGLELPFITKLISFTQKSFYYKTKMLYPFDLYYPVWILFSIIFIDLVKPKKKLK